MVKAKSYTLPFIKKEELAKNIYSFYFKRNKFPDFIPGQYVYITLPHEDVDDRGSNRYFTISSSPLDKEHLVITTRIIKSSFKKALFDLQPKTEVSIFGPMGWFLLPKDEKKEKVFISGGIGITPFHSLLQTLRDQVLENSIILFATFSNSQEFIFYENLMKITNQNKKIKSVFLSERISKSWLKKHVKDLQRAVYYVVGSEGMVASTKALLLELGIGEERIQTEDFTGY